MAEFSLAHIGINAENEADALKIAELFAALFSFEVKPGNSSVFAGTAVEVMKTPYLGANGHIAIGTPDVAAAQAELEARGFAFRPGDRKIQGRRHAERRLSERRNRRICRSSG